MICAYISRSVTYKPILTIKKCHLIERQVLKCTPVVEIYSTLLSLLFYVNDRQFYSKSDKKKRNKIYMVQKSTQTYEQIV